MSFPALSWRAGGLALLLLPVSIQAQPEAQSWRALVKHYEQVEPAPLLDRELFAEQPRLSFARLSPDGRRVLYAVEDGAATALNVMDTVSLSTSPLLSSTKIRDVHWSRTGAHAVIELRDAVGIWSFDGPGRASYVTTLDRSAGDYVLGADHSSAGVIVVRRNTDREYVLERYQPAGDAEQIIAGEDRISGAIVSENAGAFVELESERGKRIIALAEGVRELLIECGLFEQCTMLGYDEERETLWLSGAIGEHDRIGLYAYDLAERSLQRAHEDPTGIADLEGLATIDARPVIAQYHAGRQESYALDEGVAQRLESVTAQLAKSNVTFSLASDSGIWLLRETSAVLRDPRHYLQRSPSGPIVEILASERSTATPLPESALSDKLPVRYAARDGMLLHGYVSLPKGLPLAQSPLVAWVHGGPIAEVDPGFATYTQFLVNRGYIVFEPNFRGSTGYGREYVLRSNKDFGNGVVHRDIIDGVEHLLSQGIGHPDRLAIGGASFGGFSALAGLAFSPERFRAGVAIVPPADLAVPMRHQASRPGYLDDHPASRAMLERLVADPHDPADLDRLTRQSPLARLADVSAPLLVLAGGKDDRVPVAHVKDYTLALLGRGRRVRLLLDAEQGHGGWSKRATIGSLQLIEAFFAEHLGGRQQALNDPSLERYLRRNVVIGGESTQPLR